MHSGNEKNFAPKVIKICIRLQRKSIESCCSPRKERRINRKEMNCEKLAQYCFLQIYVAVKGSCQSHILNVQIKTMLRDFWKLQFLDCFYTQVCFSMVINNLIGLFHTMAHKSFHLAICRRKIGDLKIDSFVCKFVSS